MHIDDIMNSREFKGEFVSCIVQRSSSNNLICNDMKKYFSCFGTQLSLLRLDTKNMSFLTIQEKDKRDP
jgi:hypothetical protein